MLVNPHAGGGRAGRLLPEAEAALRALPVEVRVERTESLEHARSLAATAADAGETVVTLSGDGLIGCVAWVAAANAKAYGGGIYAAPGAELDGGALDVVVAESMRKVRFLTSLLPRAFKGTHVDMPEVHVMRTSRLRVDADRPFDVYADGDPIGRTPATIEVLPAAIRVLCPA